MAGATDRLDRPGAPIGLVEFEHRVAGLFQMPAPAEDGLGQDLRRPHLQIAGLAHAAADVTLDDVIERKAARVPEHHARPLLLLVKQVKPVAQAAMIFFVHDTLLVSMGIEAAERLMAKIRNAPSVAGGPSGRSRLRVAQRMTKPAGPPRRVVRVVVSWATQIRFMVITLSVARADCQPGIGER